MGNRKVRLGIIKLVRKKAEEMWNPKVILGIIKLVRKKEEDGNGEP